MDKNYRNIWFMCQGYQTWCVKVRDFQVSAGSS
jgi:hypothetical protein